jgi:hypothetical protein
MSVSGRVKVNLMPLFHHFWSPVNHDFDGPKNGLKTDLTHSEIDLEGRMRAPWPRQTEIYNLVHVTKQLSWYFDEKSHSAPFCAWRPLLRAPPYWHSPSMLFIRHYRSFSVHVITNSRCRFDSTGSWKRWTSKFKGTKDQFIWSFFFWITPQVCHVRSWLIEAEKREDQLDINKLFDVGDIDEPESVPWKINVLKIEWIWVDPGQIRDESASDPRTLTIQGSLPIGYYFLFLE